MVAAGATWARPAFRAATCPLPKGSSLAKVETLKVVLPSFAAATLANTKPCAALDIEVRKFQCSGSWYAVCVSGSGFVVAGLLMDGEVATSPARGTLRCLVG